MYQGSTRDRKCLFLFQPHSLIAKYGYLDNNIVKAKKQPVNIMQPSHPRSNVKIVVKRYSQQFQTGIITLGSRRLQVTEQVSFLCNREFLGDKEALGYIFFLYALKHFLLQDGGFPSPAALAGITR